MKSSRKKALARGIATALVLGAVGGGLAYTKLTVDEADRTAPTKGWQASEKGVPTMEELEKHRYKGRTDTALSKELLPLPDDYRLGPDIGAFGNDVSLSGPKAEAWFGESEKGLTESALKEHRKFVSELDLQGMAMRSYVRIYDYDLLVEIRLAQMDKSAVKERNAFRSELVEVFSALRKGPQVNGYENASCFLLPEAEDDAAAEIEKMYCTAYEDDTLVSFTAVGSAPFAAKEAARLLEKQLDRLTLGGGISA